MLENRVSIQNLQVMPGLAEVFQTWGGEHKSRAEGEFLLWLQSLLVSLVT